MHKLPTIPLPFSLEPEQPVKQAANKIATALGAILADESPRLATTGPGMLRRAFVRNLKQMKTKQRSYSNDLIDEIVKELQPL